MSECFLAPRYTRFIAFTSKNDIDPFPGLKMFNVNPKHDQANFESTVITFRIRFLISTCSWNDLFDSINVTCSEMFILRTQL